ncbi:MAG: hypothetical protein GC178_17855 [Flavobacteriales bacterium]|nr:hypothetical protein [Flavobacteriales bacterium]
MTLTSTYGTQNGPVFTDIHADTDYSLQIVDGLGCTIDLTGANGINVPRDGFHSLGVSASLSSYPGGYNISSFGGNDGWIDLNIYGQMSHETILWSDGNTDKNRGGLTAGTYEVTVSDNAGQSITKSWTLTQPQAGMSVMVSGQYSSCSSSGQLNAMVNGGTPPYSYQWTGPNGPLADAWSTVMVTLVGHYDLTVTDANAQIALASIDLQSAPQLWADVNSPQIYGNFNTSCTGGDGSIVIDLHDGIPPYTIDVTSTAVTSDSYSGTTATGGVSRSSIHLTTSDASAVVDALDPGSYNVNISDMSGCGGQNYSLNLAEPDPLLVSVVPTVQPNGYYIGCETCADGQAEMQVTNTYGNVEYVWAQVPEEFVESRIEGASLFQRFEDGDVDPTELFDGGLPFIIGTAAQQGGLGGGVMYAAFARDELGCFGGEEFSLEKPNPGAVGASGATGPTGATGATGATGPQGIAGVTGPQGATGPQGVTGSQGAVGPTGAQGPQGVAGAQGVTGPQGIQGDLGPQGPTGAQGPQGVTGATGSQGIQGATGAQGAVGPTGEQGPQGIAGAQGATGPQGIQGDLGPQGPTGAQGPAGANGTSVQIHGSATTSTNLPASGNTTGDGYLTQDDGHLWVWGGTDWTDVGQIQGPGGATGPQGPAGLQGATGPQGPAGQDGVEPAPAWRLGGNSGTNNWLGTDDNTDLVLKANNQTQLKLGSDGITEVTQQLKMSNLEELVPDAADAEPSILVIRADGSVAAAPPPPEGFLHFWADRTAGSCGSIDGGNSYPLEVMGSWSYDINEIYSCPQVNVGIGTDEPIAKMDVRGQTYSQLLSVNTYDSPAKLTVNASTGYDGVEIRDKNGLAAFNADENGKIIIGKEYYNQSGGRASIYLGNSTDHYISAVQGLGLSFSTIGGADALVVKDGGYVGVGTSNPTAPLHLNNNGAHANTFKIDVYEDYRSAIEVFQSGTQNFLVQGDGKIWGRELNVKVGTFPDYVFKKEYVLPALTEVEDYVKKNSHLPEVPSAKEVEENGMNVGEMNTLLLKKVEELTLYLIEQDKRIQQLQDEVNNLRD